jgi:hypothetical protein
MPRYFTLDQAERLLSRIEPAVREAASLKGFFNDAEKDLRTAAERVLLLGGAQVDQQQWLNMRGRRDALASRLKESIEAVQEHGCLMKDLDLGLIDFPTLLRGEDVYLCWKLGEQRIEFWHGTDEGYRGRKPIDQEFLDNHGAE